jgi:hypothetical protein
MRLNDVLTESQINELGVLDTIGSSIKGAVSGYKANQSKRQGQEHSDRIVANLKRDFMQVVGGGSPATYKNLIDFLTSHGLSDLDTIPDPNAAQPAAPASAASTPASTTPPNTTSAGASSSTPPPNNPPTSTPSSSTQSSTASSTPAITSTGNTNTPPVTPPAKKGFGNSSYGSTTINAPTGVPNTNNFGFTSGASTSNSNAASSKAARDAAERKRRTDIARAAGLEESVGAVLNNRAIDSIINAAVQKNYARIVAAQQGRSAPSSAPAISPNASSTAASRPATSNPFDNPRKLAADWQAYIAAGGPISGRLKRLINNMNTAAQRSQPPAAPVQAAPAPVTTPESVGHSRFLGIQL